MNRFFPLIAFSALLFAAGFPLYASAQYQSQEGSGIDYYKSLMSNQEQQEAPKKNPWQYSHKNRPAPGSGATTDILPRGEQYIYLVRTEKTKSNEAVLRMVSPVSVSGCVNVIPPTVKIRRNGSVMAIKMEDGAVALDKSVRYTHYQCRQGANTASVDVILNRDDLLRDNIRALTLQSSTNTTDTYTVDVTLNRLTLIPKSAGAFKPFMGSAKSDPLTYYFYPGNALVLYAPSAGKNADLSEQITALAQSKGLTPLPGQNSPAPLKNGTEIYFIDNAGTLAESLAAGASALVGAVDEPQSFQAADGAHEKQKPVDVYARRPGLLD